MQNLKEKKLTNIFSKKKLKKKFRFWRRFKFSFLNLKKKIIFFRLKWIFNQKKILWHQFSEFYGKKIKNLAFIKNQSKKAFNVNFFSVLFYLENRLNIILLRLSFFSKLLKANNFISKKTVIVNNKLKNYNFLVKVGDIIICENIFKVFFHKKWFNFFKWRKFKWRKWKRKVNNYLNFFWLTKKNLVMNYIEVNYKIFAFIQIRKQLIGEILLNNKSKMLSLNLLKKIYFLY